MLFNSLIFFIFLGEGWIWFIHVGVLTMGLNPVVFKGANKLDLKESYESHN